jgi:conjugal transfer pilus assembly protein TraE
VILVPGLQQEVWTSDHQVSSSYLEETTMMYLPLLLDLEPQTIEWKRDRILAYVARTDGNYLQQLQDYFARAKEEYSKFGLRTHFAVKKLTVDESKLEVIAEGLLISLFGDYGTDSRQAHYLLRFDWVGGKLLIKEFKKITEEKLG